MQYRIMQIAFVRKRICNFDKHLNERECWRDKSFMILDQAGNLYRSKDYWWHEAPIFMEENCLSIMPYSDRYLTMRMDGQNINDLSVEFGAISALDWQRSLLEQEPKWPKIRGNEQTLCKPQN